MKIAILGYFFQPDPSLGAMRPENWNKWVCDNLQVGLICHGRPAVADCVENFQIRPKPSISASPSAVSYHVQIQSDRIRAIFPGPKKIARIGFHFKLRN